VLRFANLLLLRFFAIRNYQMSRQYTLQRAPRSTSIHVDYAAELNQQQLAAVTAPPGPILVIAGAGSGKTRTLTYRVAYLLEKGIDPRNILLLTFTNKAAREMLGRVANLLPVDASGLWGGTFHSIGNRILRRHGSALGYWSELASRAFSQSYKNVMLKTLTSLS
jgi:DNA helicase-2/ATP-dependent DNA helicase PcrA